MHFRRAPERSKAVTLRQSGERSSVIGDGYADVIEAAEYSSRIVANVSKRCTEYVFNKIMIGCILFQQDNTVLAMDENARKILNEAGSSYGK